ncbi:MAG: hypothetical protein EHM24_24430 [Acidobacteria bacterium]|nr:MAG: hypothetical protein EHM24_24430 [Acidobacteriota bacterium]
MHPRGLAGGGAPFRSRAGMVCQTTAIWLAHPETAPQLQALRLPHYVNGAPGQHFLFVGTDEAGENLAGLL